MFFFLNIPIASELGFYIATLKFPFTHYIALSVQVATYCLLITNANSLDPDQAQHVANSVDPDQTCCQA